MKQRVCMICAGCLFLLLLGAGCTGIPGIFGASSPESPAAADPAAIAGTSWTGTYMTTWQGGGHDIRMVLVQSGSTVTGTYEYSDGQITGTVQGNRLVGTWVEDSGDSKGPVEFEMAADGKTFAGWWDYEGEDFSETRTEPPSWTGIRVA